MDSLVLKYSPSTALTASGEIHNNKMERFNGEVRDREKVMRSLKRSDSPALKGYQIYHNYIRPHMALENKTPADKAGIKVKGKDKWLTLIQNAVQDSKKCAKSQGLHD